MPGPAVVRFLQSMKIGYEQWHDGIGYELDALSEMTPDERAEVERTLIAHLADPGDWRDLEALAALGTPTAMDAVRSARHHRTTEIRNYALKTLVEVEPHSAEELEDAIIRAVEHGALGLAETHPTPRVKRALLDCARLAEPTIRVNAAALLMFLCGKTREPFDWSERPFFLRFGSEDMKELRAAWGELRERTGV